MADSGFADTIREALGLAKSMAICNEPWTSQAHDALDASFAALAGLEAELRTARNTPAPIDPAFARAFETDTNTLHLIYERDRLAASLETTREALTGLMDACGWLPTTKRIERVRVAWDNAVEALNAADLTRPRDATIVPAADQGGQNDGVDSER